MNEADLDILIQSARKNQGGLAGGFVRQLVGELTDALETLRGERDAVLAREAALREALQWCRTSFDTVLAGKPHRAVAEMRACVDAALASSPPAAEPEGISLGGKPGDAT